VKRIVESSLFRFGFKEINPRRCPTIESRSLLRNDRRALFEL